MSRGTVLVTGSAGFIGGYVVEELLARDYEVVGLDDHSKYGPVVKSYDDHPNYRLVVGDARDTATLTDGWSNHERHTRANRKSICNASTRRGRPHVEEPAAGVGRHICCLPVAARSAVGVAVYNSARRHSMGGLDCDRDHHCGVAHRAGRRRCRRRTNRAQIHCAIR